MIKLEELKKGDHVLVVANDWLDYRDSEKCTEVVVTSLGRRYIGVQEILADGTPYGRTEKYYNDERCARVDWGHWRLFLGTKEEWLKARELAKTTRDIYREVYPKICEGLGYEKLKAIRDIIYS
jgi:hypothetical protein